MNSKLYLLTFVFLMLLSFIPFSNAFAEGEVEYNNMEQMIGAIRLEKKQIENILDKMMISGRMSTEEGIRVKREIANVKESDFEKIKTQVIAELNNQK